MPEFTSNNNYVSSAETILPSRLNRFLSDVQAQIELHAARVAAGNSPVGEIEVQFQRVLQAARSASPDRFEGVRQRMAAPLARQKTDRRYALFADVEVDRSGALEEIDVVEVHRASVAPFANTWINIPTAIDGMNDADIIIHGLVPQAGYTGLKFHICKVKCVEETDEIGSDEIYLGGNFVDETGDVSYSWFRVSNDFDTGEVRDYGFPGKELQYFNISEAGSKFPKIYTSVLTMVEEDWGNMEGWFRDLFEKIKSKVKEMLKKLGYAVGELIGLGAVGELIGAIFVKVFDWLVGWIVSIFENDYMGTFSTKATLNSYTGNWTATNGPIFSWSKKFIAHGGHYHVWYAWQLVK